MSNKYYWPPDMDYGQAVEYIGNILRSAGFIVANDDKQVWCALSARKGNYLSTKLYSGLTPRAKARRNWLRIVGPEEDAIMAVLQHEGQDAKANA